MGNLYLVFAGYDHDAQGGMGDLIGCVEREEDAQALVDKFGLNSQFSSPIEWAHYFNVGTGAVVFPYGYEPDEYWGWFIEGRSSSLKTSVERFMLSNSTPQAAASSKGGRL